MNDSWTPPDAPKARAEREYAALFRIYERHANDDARRNRGRHPAMIGPLEAVRVLVSLAAGSAVVEDGEDAVDNADLIAALTLVPSARAEMDQLEASLLLIARAQGMTWQELAFALGLGSAQAARQRYERLALRVAPDTSASDAAVEPREGHSGTHESLLFLSSGLVLRVARLTAAPAIQRRTVIAGLQALEGRLIRWRPSSVMARQGPSDASPDGSLAVLSAIQCWRGSTTGMS